MQKILYALGPEIPPETSVQAEAPSDQASDHASNRTIVAIDDDFLTSAVAGTDPISKEIELMWPSVQDYHAMGLGFACVTGDRVACWCTAEHISADSCGMGIETAGEYRRRGFVYATAKRFLQECSSRRLTPYWECDKDNAPSARLAEKLGLRRLQSFDAGYYNLA